jgi:hypothetical protein
MGTRLKKMNNSGERGAIRTGGESRASKLIKCVKKCNKDCEAVKKKLE